TLVLLCGAVADADVAGSAQGLAGAHGDFALGEAAEHRGFVGVAQVYPGEVGVGVGGAETEAPQALLDGKAGGDRALDAAQDIVLVADRLRPRSLGEGVDAEGLADGVDRGAELRRADRVAD